MAHGAYGGSRVQILELGPEKKILNSSCNPLSGLAIAKVAGTWKPLRFFRQMCRLLFICSPLHSEQVFGSDCSFLQIARETFVSGI